MSSEQIAKLGLGRTECRKDFLELMFRNKLSTNVVDDGEHKDTTIVEKVAVEVFTINNQSVFALIGAMEDKKMQLDLEQEIEAAWEMDLLAKANEDVEVMLNQEMDEGEAPIEQVIEEQVKEGVQKAMKPLEAEIRKLKQQLRAKDSGGGTDHRSKAGLNGQKRNEGSTDSSKPSAANSGPPHRQNQQTNNQRQRKRGGRGGSNRGGRKPGSGRS